MKGTNPILFCLFGTDEDIHLCYEQYVFQLPKDGLPKRIMTAQEDLVFNYMFEEHLYLN